LHGPRPYYSLSSKQTLENQIGDNHLAKISAGITKNNNNFQQLQYADRYKILEHISIGSEVKLNLNGKLGNNFMSKLFNVRVEGKVSEVMEKTKEILDNETSNKNLQKFEASLYEALGKTLGLMDKYKEEYEKKTQENAKRKAEFVMPIQPKVDWQILSKKDGWPYYKTFEDFKNQCANNNFIDQDPFFKVPVISTKRDALEVVYDKDPAKYIGNSASSTPKSGLKYLIKPKDDIIARDFCSPLNLYKLKFF
jgi:hypothetical protein